MKLKYREVAEYRQQQLSRQNYTCALCNEQIEGDAVLDHDHKTGLVRQVLHRGCNALLGKLENNLARNLMTESRLQNWLINFMAYTQTAHTQLVHPTHKTKEQKHARTPSKRTKRR